jgi:hypothetical protein
MYLFQMTIFRHNRLQYANYLINNVSSLRLVNEQCKFEALSLVQYVAFHQATNHRIAAHFES